MASGVGISACKGVVPCEEHAVSFRPAMEATRARPLSRMGGEGVPRVTNCCIKPTYTAAHRRDARREQGMNSAVDNPVVNRLIVAVVRLVQKNER